ncbi:MAG: putative amidase [Firmicutes bacterium]|nr:putative amidase [Bacillota bacterium]
MPMSADELCGLTIQAVGSAYRGRSLSPVEVTRAVLARIERLNPRLNAYITVTAETALAQAQKAEHDFMQGVDQGALQGVPLSLKDLYWTAGVRTTAASRILRDFIPTEDAEVVQRLRKAGAVLLGKTNMKEFAYGQVHPDYGPALNPWNEAHTSGGSSSGSGSALAAGLGYGSMGSDTGGSLRNPASYCGIVALKPTYGLVSCHGMIPLSWSLDHAGPMTRTVCDNALLLAAVAGHDPKDPASAVSAPSDYVSGIDKGVRGIRIGTLTSYTDGLAAPAVQAAVVRAAAVLREAGASVTEVSLPELATVNATFTAIIRPEASAAHAQWLHSRGPDYHPVIRDHLEAGARLPAVDYIQAQRHRQSLREAVERVLRAVDVLLLPTTATTAPPETGVTDLSVTTRLTAMFNLTGCPALSLPCGLDPAGLPIGLQIVGRPFAESMVYRVAAAFESVAGFEPLKP